MGLSVTRTYIGAYGVLFIRTNCGTIMGLVFIMILMGLLPLALILVLMGFYSPQNLWSLMLILGVIASRPYLGDYGV